MRKGSIQLATAKVTLMRYTIHQDESQNASQGGVPRRTKRKLSISCIE